MELRAKDYLEGGGYYVIRSAGSHGLIDLVAIKWDHVLFIQVKGRGISAQEVEKIMELQVPPNCYKEIWLWDVETRTFAKQSKQRV